MIKRYLILVSIILLSFSCLKNSRSSTSSEIGSINGKVYYYKTCNSQYICKFQCEEGTDISKLTDENVSNQCKTLVAVDSTTIADSYDEKVRKAVIEPILTSNNFKVLPVDYDLFIDFDKKFSQFSSVQDAPKTYKNACTSECDESNLGITPNVWKKISDVDNSNVIYQHFSLTPIGNIQWTKLLGSPTKMSYQDAVKTCEEYNYRYSDWSLPSGESLALAIKYRIFETLDIKNITPDYFVWTKDKEKSNTKNSIEDLILIRQLLVPWGTDPQDKYISSDSLNYVICARQAEYKS